MSMLSQRAAFAALIIAYCLVVTQVTAANEPTCEKLSSAEATRILKEANEAPAVYCQLDCAVNVLRLFKFIQARFPHLQPKDFRVIYVARPGFINTLGWLDDEARFHMNVRDDRDEEGQRFKWKYHIVLEHNQEIFDLDYSNDPVPVKASHYFRTVFSDDFDPRKQNWWRAKLQAFIFPGEEYLTLHPDIVSSVEFETRVVNFNRGIPLADVPAALINK